MRRHSNVKCRWISDDCSVFFWSDNIFTNMIEESLLTDKHLVNVPTNPFISRSKKTTACCSHLLCCVIVQLHCYAAPFTSADQYLSLLWLFYQSKCVSMTPPEFAYFVNEVMKLFVEINKDVLWSYLCHRSVGWFCRYRCIFLTLIFQGKSNVLSRKSLVLENGWPRSIRVCMTGINLLNFYHR